jgi:hypothetical protein
MLNINDLISVYQEDDTMNNVELKILHMSEIDKHFKQPNINEYDYNSLRDSDQSDWYTKQNFNYGNVTKEQHRLRKFRIMNYYMKKFNCKTVLDVGFGSGYHTWNSAVNGFDVTGADFENGAYFMMQDLINKTGISNLELISLNTQNITDLKKSYDAVLSIEVLEHILDPLPLHEAQIKLCDKIFFLEEYCGDRTVTGHIAPMAAKQQIVDMCLDYGFIELPLSYGYPPQIFIKKELL